jgi:hypothetical protein
MNWRAMASLLRYKSGKFAALVGESATARNEIAELEAGLPSGGFAD